MGLINDVMALNKLLGYPPKEAGICHGFSLLWLEAHLRDQDREFVERIQLIQTILTDHNERDIHELFNQVKTKKGIGLTTDDRALLDILVFFESLELYHSPFDHPDLFNTPDALNQIDVKQASLLASSDNALGDIASVYSESVAYTESEIEHYLNELGLILNEVLGSSSSESAIGILLDSVDATNHAMAMVYEGMQEGKPKWRFINTGVNINITDSALADVENTAMIAKRIFAGFQKIYSLNNPVVFNLSIITKNDSVCLPELSSKLDEFKKRTKPDAMYQRKGLADLAAFHGDLALLETLAEHNVDLTDRRTADLAAQQGAVEVVVALAKKGTRFDEASLYLAAKFGKSGVIAELAKTPYGLDLNKALNGATPALIAAYNGHANVITELARHEADLNKASPNNGLTPFFLAAQQGHVHVISALLLAGANMALPFTSSTESLRTNIAKTKNEGAISRLDDFLEN